MRAQLCTPGEYGISYRWLRRRRTPRCRSRRRRRKSRWPRRRSWCSPHESSPRPHTPRSCWSQPASRAVRCPRSWSRHLGQSGRRWQSSRRSAIVPDSTWCGAVNDTKPTSVVLVVGVAPATPANNSPAPSTAAPTTPTRRRNEARLPPGDGGPRTSQLVDPGRHPRHRRPQLGDFGRSRPHGCTGHRSSALPATPDPTVRTHQRAPPRGARQSGRLAETRRRSGPRDFDRTSSVPRAMLRP
jgi:hypothetical protein